MIDTLPLLPSQFWVVIALLVGGTFWALRRLRAGIGLPSLAVLATVTVWYVGDVLYNDYPSTAISFSETALENAWSQVALFLVFFYLLSPLVHDFVNVRYLRKPSVVFRMWRDDVDNSSLQQGLSDILRLCVAVWITLALIATFRIGSEIPYYVFPFLDHKANPWERGRLGGGVDAFLSLAAYLQLFSAGSFGIVAAISKRPTVRRLALVGCIFAWPYFIFDRTRNTMLSAVIPGVLTWVVFRIRGTWIKKGLILTMFFLIVNAWFGFVIANRSNMTIMEALTTKGFDVRSDAEAHHDGLNMYEELCWINTFLESGVYEPNRGERYLAELVSIVPRSFWPDKPLIGIDYAILRGQSYAGGDGGVGASISTGMIGQGVVNFGRFFGPAFAAFLMSLWVAILARMDLSDRDSGRFPLYGFGLILTFNMGRDITLLTLYSFVFGSVAVWCMNRVNGEHSVRNKIA